MKILIAPNAFKHAASTFEIGNAIQSGLLKFNNSLQAEVLPLSDGGNDFLEVIFFLKKHLIKVPVDTSDPLMRPLQAYFAFDENSKTAYIEMALASGVHLLKQAELNPLIASSYGTGLLIKYAIAYGAKEIIIGIGGTATVDGGMGILSALGFKFYDINNNILNPSGANLLKIKHFDDSEYKRLWQNTSLIIASDVSNFLLGSKGAAMVFGPQKGASPEMITVLENGLRNFCEIFKDRCSIDLNAIKGGGAAGGAGSILQGILHGTFIKGAEFVLDLCDFKGKLVNTDILITAEGKLDGQTFVGKAPYTVALKAKESGIKTIVLAGKIDNEFYHINSKQKVFDHAFEIAPSPYLSLQQAMENTLGDLEQISSRLLNLIE
jgi:glycerate 2-kinase